MSQNNDTKRYSDIERYSICYPLRWNWIMYDECINKHKCNTNSNINTENRKHDKRDK